MTALIIDTSVTMAWCFGTQATSYTRAARELAARRGAIVPSLWLYEVTNVLVLARRKRALTADQVSGFLDLLRRLKLQVEAPAPDQVFEEAYALAEQHRLTAYDAAFLELARRYHLPLATTDQALALAARAERLFFEPASETA